MAESFDAWQYLSHLRARWLFIAAVGAVAVSGALALSLLLPKKFTATSRILIESPAGTDLRSATAISPIYLESLKTYEHFASSESLFARAMTEFHLRERFGNRSAESLKRNVLQVSIPRDTKILEIRTTLPDAKLAQALAQYLAEETVKMNRSVVGEGDRDLLDRVEQQYNLALAGVDEKEARWSQLLIQDPMPELQSEIDAQLALRALLQRQLLASEMDSAEYADRLKHPEDARGADLSGWQAGARVRIEVLRKQLRETETRLARNQRLMAERRSRFAKLEEERKAARATLALIETRLQEARGTAGYRGERLKIIDPGIVPERPSFPNLPLNVVGAAVLGLLAALIFLTLEFAYQRRRIVGFPTGRSEETQQWLK
jgi:uncharacterized protein involved in exopolysaccharide biosynthesis